MNWYSSNTPLIIGHRGASAYAPENTLAAFRLAVDQGADGIEFDVQLSADGWPVIMHDFQVDRTTNGTGLVSSLTVAELQALDAGEGQGVPTLDDVFEMFGPGVLYNVEIKDFSWRRKGIEEAVADRIQSFQLENQVLVSSFNPLSVRYARRCLSRSTPVAFVRESDWWKYAHPLVGSQADHPHYSMVNETYMAWAAKKGYRVHVWTVDDPDEARRLNDLGVHAIFSNKPDLIRESLK